MKHFYTYRISFLLFLLLCVAWDREARAQTGITGIVRNSAQEVMPGVSVQIKGTALGTQTDEAGRFRLDLPSLDGTIRFSFLGFQTKEVPINGRTEFLIELSENASTLEDVVVVGYGTQEKVNLTGAVSAVRSDEITGKLANNTSTALQGLAAGVTVTPRSGQPGSTGTIRIRGIGTLGNANPLVLIDGVEGDLNNIDPNLIESISILKDAASASIYGSRAANGVILITTKRATSDQLSVSYHGYTGWQRATDLPEKVDAIDHMLLTNEAYTNTGKAPLYSQELIDQYIKNAAVQPDIYPNTDWQKEILTGSGFMQNHFVTVNGGSKNVKFLTSAGLFEQKGLLEHSGFNRFTFRNNADIRFSDKVNMTVDLQVDNKMTREPGRGTESVFYQMNRIPANQPGQFQNGTWGVGWNGNNPIAYSRAEGGDHKNNHPEIFLNTSLTYQPTEWLEAKLTVAPKYAESIDHVFKRAISTYNADGSLAYTQPAKSSLDESVARSFYNNFYGTLTFSKSFDADSHLNEHLANFKITP